MIIKPPKPGLGFGIRDSGFWDLGFGLALAWVWQKKLLQKQPNLIITKNGFDIIVN